MEENMKKVDELIGVTCDRTIKAIKAGGLNDYIIADTIGRVIENITKLMRVRMEYDEKNK